MLGRPVLLLLCLCAVASPRAWAGLEVAAPGLVSLDYGLICSLQDGVDTPAPGTDAGTVRRFGSPASVVVSTDRIALEPGATFGVAVALPPPGAPVVTITLTHPPFLETGTEIERYTTAFEPLTPHINAFTFDLRREMVPGRWTLQAETQGNVLYRIAFDLVEDGTGASAARECAPPDVVSGREAQGARHGEA